MNYKIVSSSKLSQKAQEELIGEISRVEKNLYKSEDFECRIVVSFKDNKSRVEVTIPTPYLLLRSEVEADELSSAASIAKDKLLLQIEKIKSRLDRSSNKVNLGRTFGLEDIPESQEEIYIKNKTVHPKAMTLDDAILEMESTDHDFFIYEDIEDHGISVVYRRKAGGYGVIDID